jgi:hypothetical protein
MIISMLVIGVASLVLFVIVEWRVAKLPMMPSKPSVMICPVATVYRTSSDSTLS